MDQTGNSVAVVNPKVLYSHGARLTLVCFSSERWLEDRDKLINLRIPSYNIFGRYDLICKCFETDKCDAETRLRTSGIRVPRPPMFSKFIVDRIDRYAGFDIDNWDIKIDLSYDEEEQVTRLQQDWTAEENPVRRNLIDRKIILPEPIVLCNWYRKDYVKSFVFVRFLVVADWEVQRYLIQKELLDKYKDSVVSLFWSSPNVGAYFHLAIEIATKTLAELVNVVLDGLHQSIPGGRYNINTETYISANPLHDKQTTITEEMHVLFPQHPLRWVEETEKIIQELKTNLINTYPSDNEKVFIINSALASRTDIPHVFLELIRKADIICALSQNNDIIERVKKALVDAFRAWIFEDPGMYCIALLPLATGIEKAFRDLLMEKAKKIGTATEIQQRLKLSSSKISSDKLTAGEIAEAMKKWNEDEELRSDPILSATLIDRWRTVLSMRDICVHEKKDIQESDFIEKAQSAIQNVFFLWEGFLELTHQQKQGCNFLSTKSDESMHS